MSEEWEVWQSYPMSPAKGNVFYFCEVKLTLFIL
jgi:hypothetical protein